MPDPASPNKPDFAQIKSSLTELASLLRDARHLDPESQQSLADLLDELGDELDPSGVAADHATRLADTTIQLARALQENQHAGLLTAAKERLSEAASRAETSAPVASGIVRRFIDALASMGI